jgi:Heterokaryon incompatibility protein (HET)
MAGSSSIFQYLPLIAETETNEAIRLLDLLPGQIDDELRCVLHRASLSRPPPFEALSYTWGNPKGFRSLTPCKSDFNATYCIKIGKQNKTIGYNLSCALRSLRQESSIRTLWMDAICINQEDDQEKNEQVNKMARIFGRAVRVLAWLGEVDEFVDLAFDTVRDFCWATKYSLWQNYSKQLNIPIEKLAEETVLSTIKAQLTSEDLSQGKLDDFRYAFQSMAVPGFDLTSATRFSHYLLSREAVSYEDVQIFERIEAIREVFLERAYWRRLWIV